MSEINKTYTSILQAFLDLKKWGKSFCTLHRELGIYDVIFSKVTDGVTSYIRFRKVMPREGVSCIVAEISDDPDTLAESPVDPERYFSFDTTNGGTVQMNALYNEEGKFISVAFRCRGHERYFGKMELDTVVGSMWHEKIGEPNASPNFRVTGTPYMPCGA